MYAACALLWIFGSDALLAAFVSSPSSNHLWQTAKGALFVFATAALLRQLIAAHDATVREEQSRADDQRRMASLGQLGATFAHEFRNLLMAAVASVDVIEREGLGEKPRTRRAVENLRNTIARGNTLTNEILRFGRPASPSLRATDLARWGAAFVRDVEGLVTPSSLTVDLPDEPALASVDAEMLHQALSNLVLNARDAGAKTITFGVQLQRSLSSRRVLLFVADDGSGMTPEVRARMFEPLFSTKRTGTGLGLPLVFQIVSAHEGELFVDSTPGEGTRFCIVLPGLSELEDATAS